MVAADVVPMVDMSLPEADAAKVLKKAAVMSGFFYGEIWSFSSTQPRPPPPSLLSGPRHTHASALARVCCRHGAIDTQ